jgi:deoxycytidylate deaminase
MSADPKQFPILSSQPSGQDSRQILLDSASNELVFGVVGHAGSGTTEIAQHLKHLLETTKINSKVFDVELIKARHLIKDWAVKEGLPFPVTGPLAQSTMLQDYGDKMRGAPTKSSSADHAAVAKALILKIRSTRATKVGISAEGNAPILPDGNPRAYILDSIRHSAEVQLLRHVYKHAFILIGVVCEEERRIQRLEEKFIDGDRKAVIAFMNRDADDAKDKHGQHVADAFQLADYYLDNTAQRKTENPDPDWDVVEELSRLLKILTHSELMRPKIGETAMHHAYSAKLRSACLSRQVGAAVVDNQGNVVATGTNEVPKAGGGVYGEAFENRFDFRCAMFADPTNRVCRNTREQNEIIDELFEKIAELKAVGLPRKDELIKELRKTRIGGLVEFSRAVHAEMDALLSAARQGISLVGTRMFVTTFPCHYCARHIVAAGVDEVQFVEPYPKSKALSLHEDAIAVEFSGWKAPSQGGQKVLFRPFSGVAPQLYRAAFMKDRDLKNNSTGEMTMNTPDWGTPFQLPKISYVDLEAALLDEDSSDDRPD